MHTREQRYAELIHQRVAAFARTCQDPALRARYGGMGHKLPILIRSAGLAQALHFADTRKLPEHKLFMRDLAATIDPVRAEPLSVSQLLVHARTASLAEYMLLTQQALAALLWYKRFAQSLLNVEASDDDNHPGGAP